MADQAQELLEEVGGIEEQVVEPDPPVGSFLTERTWFAGRTPSGKGIQFKRCPRSGKYLIEFMEGGQVPAELTGLWTSRDVAQFAVNKYLEKRD